ncbi:MAG: hypothetical protein DWI21_16095 [Planctomycetota bacterium]|nr:MAG: hypothetical protein DWI21_16095 [Planctomycetota bacterium]
MDHHWRRHRKPLRHHQLTVTDTRRTPHRDRQATPSRRLNRLVKITMTTMIPATREIGATTITTTQVITDTRQARADPAACHG